MHESFISRAALIAAVLWFVTVVLLGAVWGLAVVGASPRWELAAAVMACASTSLAGVAQGRVNLLRLCALIRATAGIEPSQPSARIHSLN